jgi:hypothetical protein
LPNLFIFVIYCILLIKQHWIPLVQMTWAYQQYITTWICHHYLEKTDNDLDITCCRGDLPHYQDEDTGSKALKKLTVKYQSGTTALELNCFFIYTHSIISNPIVTSRKRLLLIQHMTAWEKIFYLMRRRPKHGHFLEQQHIQLTVSP